MPAWVRRYGFAAAVAALLAVMALVVLVKSVMPDKGSAMAAQGGPPGAKGGAGEVVGVEAAAIQTQTFSDGIQALGTAQARESIVITPKVTDVIRTIRFDSGDRVRQGAVLVELSSVEQGADLAEARASAVAADDELTRFQQLFDRGFAPRARLDAARAASQAARARVAAGQSRINDRVIRAPFSGVMGLRTASPGQLVQPGTQIGTLDDLSQIKLDFDVPEAEIAALRRGVPIVAKTAAFPDQEFRGQIAQIDSRISAQTRTLRVRALLPNPGERLRPGMLMTVEVRSNARESLAAPEGSIVDEAGSSFVFLVAQENGKLTAARRPVRTGQRTAGLVEITEGLSEGDQVIVEGVTRVRPGQGIRLEGAPEVRGRVERQQPTQGPG